jgi:hypothetical protein
VEEEIEETVSGLLVSTAGGEEEGLLEEKLGEVGGLVSLVVREELLSPEGKGVRQPARERKSTNIKRNLIIFTRKLYSFLLGKNIPCDLSL